MKARIMVVEDERLVALAIEKSLKSMGYDVPATTSTGEEAVKKVAELEPDLVLMDIRLKGAIDGVEAARRIRSSFRIPVIYLTAYSDEPTLERAKITEPFGYILKPFEEKSLQAAVEMALYKADMQAQLARTKEKLETILGCMGEGVVVCSINGTVEYLNPTAQKILLAGKPLPVDVNLLVLFKILDAETGAPAVLPLSKVISNAETVRLTNIHLATRDGKIHQVDCSLAPLRSEGSLIWGIVLVFSQASERPRAPREPDEPVERTVESGSILTGAKARRLPGLNVHALFNPSLRPAGDLFDVYSVGERGACAYIIDAANEGIQSPAKAHLLQQLLSLDPDTGATHVLGSDPFSPRDVVDRLRARMSTSAKLSSLVYCAVDSFKRMATIVQSGACGTIVQRADGSVRLLGGDAEGSPKGEAVAHTLYLEEGDRVFLHSGGLVGCENPDNQPYSADRLAAFVQKTRFGQLGQVMVILEREVRGWRGKAQFDQDVCLLALEIA